MFKVTAPEDRQGRSKVTLDKRCYNNYKFMRTLPTVITGHWQTKDVSISGKRITFAGFVRDLKATELEPGENRDIRQECLWVRRFAWGTDSRSTYALALACCFYLNIDWVMCRFFLPELQRVPQADFRLEYDEATLQRAYEHCEDMFAQEFEGFMGKLGAVRLEK
jgi:hypothetical protein